MIAIDGASRQKNKPLKAKGEIIMKLTADAKRIIRGVMENGIKNFVSSDYSRDIIDMIFDDVCNDIQETSAYETEGYFNDDDILLAVGRAILKKFGMNV